MSTIPILDQLKALGTEQARKTYRKHGVSGDQYGVSYADLKNLKKKIKVNNALIAIGGRNPQLEEKALAVAKVIGKVIVDHGETNCKTPDAAAYIEKMRARQKANA